MAQAVEGYFAVAFRSKEEAQQFSLQALHACARPLALDMKRGGTCPIVLLSRMPREDIGAFVNAGAAKLLKDAGARYAIADIPVSFDQLPDNLALLVGDEADVRAYLARGSSPEHRNSVGV